MRNSSFLFVLFLLLVNSCSKVDELTHFTRSFEESLTIPKFPLILDDPVSFPYIIETNSAEEFENYNTSPGLIEEVKLTKASMQITNPSGADFDFVKSMQFYLKADGLDEVLIASKNPVPEDIGSTLALEIVDQDLSDFIIKEEIEIRVAIATDEVMTEQLDVLIKVEFFIDAKILGV